MKVTLALATTTTALADNVDFGFYRFSVTGQPDVDTAKTVAEYDLNPGATYHALAQAYAADGSPLAFTALDFTVPGDTAPPSAPTPTPAPTPKTYEAPSGLTVTFG